MKILSGLLIILSAGCLMTCRGQLTCRDAENKPVDWFMIYKLPRNSQSTNPLIQNGVAHMYLDVNNSSFTLSKVSLNDSNQAVAYTLQQIYDSYGSQDVLYMMYNDGNPNGTENDIKGHTKGDVAFNSDSGFWLVHSVPKFPDFAKGSYFWPDNAKKFGQSMLCVSMKTAEFVKVGHQLLYNYPPVYDYSIPSSFQSQFADFVEVSKGQHVQQSPWNSSVTLTSLAGQVFTSFAKYTDFGQDLYWYWVAPALGDDLYVETWMHTQSNLPSCCNGSYHVQNVRLVGFPDLLSFKETVDHSKWAIGQNSKWVCIGDINRTGSQYKRAGGTVCIMHPLAWEAYNGAIQEADTCQALPKPPDERHEIRN